jgi:hypothetical protein
MKALEERAELTSAEKALYTKRRPRSGILPWNAVDCRWPGLE